jgi:hypothetical protein
MLKRKINYSDRLMHFFGYKYNLHGIKLMLTISSTHLKLIHNKTPTTNYTVLISPFLAKYYLK